MALRLNPGLTFGTGSHATTRLCLTALEKHITGGQTVLDLGCGSGIQSIAALLLGADHAVACDIDEKCMDVAYENAALNGVGRDRYTVRWGDVVTDQALRQELGGLHGAAPGKGGGNLPVLRHHRRPGGGGGPVPAG